MPWRAREAVGPAPDISLREETESAPVLAHTLLHYISCVDGWSPIRLAAMVVIG